MKYKLLTSYYAPLLERWNVGQQNGRPRNQNIFFVKNPC
jgi:hypothetical protein